ncbi:MAG: ankyrin repeat domain-containing protein, partial [Planctomycetota bacterium]
MRNWGWCKLKYSRGAGLVFALFGLLCGAGRLAGSELSEAIDAGDLPRVEAIIKAHPALLDQAVEASGITPLESALDHQQDAVVGWLIDQGAVPIGFATGQSSNKGTGGNAAASNAATWPFEWAIAHGDVTRLRRLLASAQHLARPPEFYSTLVEDLAAAKQSVAPMVQALLQDGMTWSVKSNRDQYALLFTAAENGDMATVKALLQAGAPANAVNQDGVALLFLVIGCKANDPGRRTDQAPVKPPVPEADRHALVTYLLDHGADPNRSNRFSWGTPLLYAIALREPDLVPVLVEHGAKINMPSPSPMPELPLVVAVEWNEVAVVKYMLAHGANPNLHDDSGYPLSEAIFAATHSRPGYPRPSQADEDAMVRMLVDAGADVNQRDENGDAPMNDLPYEGNERYAEFFLEHGGDPYARPT